MHDFERDRQATKTPRERTLNPWVQGSIPTHPDPNLRLCLRGRRLDSKHHQLIMNLPVHSSQAVHIHSLMAGVSFELCSLTATPTRRERMHDHCVLEGTEQAWFRVGLRNICGTREHARPSPNICSVGKTNADQGIYEVGGDGFEPPTPGL